MKHLRSRAVLLACWLILFFNAERLFDPIDISNAAYLFVLVMVVMIMIAPRLVRIPLWVILSVPVMLFLILKAAMGQFIDSAVTAITILESFAVIFTVFLTYWLSMATCEFESAIAKITIGHRDKLPESASAGQGYIYREIRRARNHQRPLALMAVAVDEKSLNSSVDRIVQEVQQAMMKQYKLSGVSKALCDILEDCAVIVQSNEGFLIALPETKPEDVSFIAERLQKKVAENVGVDLLIGTAMLTKDSYTFEGLVDRATENMRARMKPDVLADLQHVPAKNSMTAVK